MSPRMEPDGKVKIMNVGTTENPNLVVLEDTPFDWDAFFNTVKEKAAEYMGSPRRELLFRLNERLQGRDPGEPFNWRGLR